MFKLAKWLYDKGVQQERTRIAAALQLALRQQEVRFDTLKHYEKEVTSKDRKRRAQFDLAVSGVVQEILREIMEPKMEWVPTDSILFPNDDIKERKSNGKIKSKR